MLRKDPNNATAVYVKAMLLIEEGSSDIAYSLLNSVDDLKETKPLKLLARLQYETKKYPQAARTCERGRKIDPHDTGWILLLAKIYVKTEQKDKLVEVFEEVVKLDPDELLPRRKLATHFLDLGKNAEAEKYARMGLEIDVLDRECQRVFLEALTAQGKGDEAGRVTGRCSGCDKLTS